MTSCTDLACIYELLAGKNAINTNPSALLKRFGEQIGHVLVYREIGSFQKKRNCCRRKNPVYFYFSGNSLASTFVFEIFLLIMFPVTHINTNSSRTSFTSFHLFIYIVPTALRLCLKCIFEGQFRLYTYSLKYMKHLFFQWNITFITKTAYYQHGIKMKQSHNIHIL